MNSELKNLLQSVQTVAVIGCSKDKYRTSYHIANYLQENGIQILPVNPNYDEILGEKCYNSMSDIPADTEIDVADIFRDSQYTAGMVKEVMDWAEQSGQQPVIWTQLAVSSDEAKALAEKNNYQYIENECMMVEHGKAVKQ